MRRFIDLIAVVLLLVWPNLGSADVHFCNEAVREKVYVSYAVQQNGQWELSGWYLARPGRCASYIGDAEGEDFYYFAYNTSRSLIWNGDVEVCVEQRPFRRTLAGIENRAEDCAASGRIMKHFQKAKFDSTLTTKVLLVPGHGEQEKAVLYKEATQRQLKIWAKAGDPNARTEFIKRKKNKIQLKPSKKAAIHHKDLQDQDPVQNNSTGTFSLD